MEESHAVPICSDRKKKFSHPGGSLDFQEFTPLLVSELGRVVMLMRKPRTLVMIPAGL